MELLVCREEESDEPQPSPRRRGDHRPRSGGLTARRVVPLPESETVEFHEVVARRVEGVLVVAPRPAPRSRDKDRPPGAGGAPGRIRWTTPLDGDGDATEVLLHADDAPGGVHVQEDDRPRFGRGGKDKESSSSWVREGDVLRFDVVRESHDGSYWSLRAAAANTTARRTSAPRGWSRSNRSRPTSRWPLTSAPS